jgi:hypothetical protein
VKLSFNGMMLLNDETKSCSGCIKVGEVASTTPSVDMPSTGAKDVQVSGIGGSEARIELFSCGGGGGTTLDSPCIGTRGIYNQQHMNTALLQPMT